MAFNLFHWKRRFKVNYQRDSAHALPVYVAINDSGQVEKVEGL